MDIFQFVYTHSDGKQALKYHDVSEDKVRGCVWVSYSIHILGKGKAGRGVCLPCVSSSL
jgi:hypothetical protein